MEKQILKAEHIQKYYGGRGHVTQAIDDISFEVRKGEFAGIMGDCAIIGLNQKNLTNTRV